MLIWTFFLVLVSGTLVQILFAPFSYTWYRFLYRLKHKGKAEGLICAIQIDGNTEQGKVKNDLVTALKFTKKRLLPGVRKPSPMEMLTKHNIA
jgi:hypothetical protein